MECHRERNCRNAHARCHELHAGRAETGHAALRRGAPARRRRRHRGCPRVPQRGCASRAFRRKFYCRRSNGRRRSSQPLHGAEGAFDAHRTARHDSRVDEIATPVLLARSDQTQDGMRRSERGSMHPEDSDSRERRKACRRRSRSASTGTASSSTASAAKGCARSSRLRFTIRTFQSRLVGLTPPTDPKALAACIGVTMPAARSCASRKAARVARALPVGRGSTEGSQEAREVPRERCRRTS